MLQSQLLNKTKKKISKEAGPEGHRFLLRADFVEQLAAGIFSFLPLGYRVLQKIVAIIRQEMDSIGGQEVFLPSLQPKEIWRQTDRWDHMDPPLFKLKDRHKKEFALGSTHEEVITKIARDRVQSYRDLPLYLYQIQNKFRNEMRSTGGLLRNREFLMKDLYSFHTDEQDLHDYFDKVAASYEKIFKRCQVKTIKCCALGGTMADKQARTLEFQVQAEAGEDTILFCDQCGFASNLEATKLRQGQCCSQCKHKLKQASCIELGHIFCLGDKYSKAFNLQYVDKQGKQRPVIMGCYGIGAGRLMGAVAEIHHDEKGLVWPKEVAPFQVHLIELPEARPRAAARGRASGAAQKLYQELQEAGIEVLYDDREGRAAGEKFAEADLLGIPLRIVVSERTLEKDSVELKERATQEIRLVKIRGLITILESNLC